MAEHEAAKAKAKVCPHRRPPHLHGTERLYVPRLVGRLSLPSRPSPLQDAKYTLSRLVLAENRKRDEPQYVLCTHAAARPSQAADAGQARQADCDTARPDECERVVGRRADGRLRRALRRALAAPWQQGEQRGGAQGGERDQRPGGRVGGG